AWRPRSPWRAALPRFPRGRRRRKTPADSGRPAPFRSPAGSAFALLPRGRRARRPPPRAAPPCASASTPFIFLSSYGEDVIADSGDDLPRPDPGRDRLGRVPEKDRPIGGVPAVERGPRRPVRLLRRGAPPDEAVGDRFKSVGLIDHAAQGVGKTGIVDPVEDDRAHRHLSFEGLPLRFRGDDAG